MRMKTDRFSALLVAALLFAPIVATAQEQALTVEDYSRAEQFLPWNAAKLTLNLDPTFHWIEKSDRFWFRYEQTADSKQFVLVDPDRNVRQAAFDHAKLAAALSTAAGRSYSAEKLPFDAFDFVQNGQAIQIDVEKSEWVCDLTSYTCKKAGPSASPAESRSPDKRWSAFVKDHNLYVRSLSTQEEIQLTNDGTPDDGYATQPDSNTHTISDRITMGAAQPIEVAWSPDSKKLLTYKVDQTKVREAYLIQSVPPGPIGVARPVLYSYHYPFPGDKNVAMLKYYVFDIDKKTQTPVNVAEQPVNAFTPLSLHWAWWNRGGDRVYFISSDRWYRTLRLSVAEASTGNTRTIIEERSETEIDPGVRISDPPVVRAIERSNEVVWFSQRDGWGHLYLYDANTGQFKNQITSGSWLVQAIEYVDEVNRWVYFSASGREKGEDPYLRHLYRVKLDGSGLELLTPANADHTVTFSSSGRYFVDLYSRADKPPVSELRAADGKLIRELAKGDVTQLLAKGWTSPEPFQAKAADGVTDIYGVIYRPPNLDSSKKYPVLDSIYPGPQVSRTPKAFSAKRFDGSLDPYGKAAALAQLGFVVITVDGRGTPLRSKAFLDYSYGKLGDAGGLEDHVAAIKQLGARYSYLDLNRVGMYGHSGGGFATVRAMLEYPDFYKVGVSSSGEHDQRGYIALWGEKYQGPFESSDYAEASNPALALTANLKGKILIAWGDMDDNVPPTLEIQLIHSLIKTNRDFDLLVLPNRNHTLSDDPYFIRRQWDYLVKNLLGKEPPAEYAIKSPSPAYRTLDAAAGPKN